MLQQQSLLSSTIPSRTCCVDGTAIFIAFFLVENISSPRMIYAKQLQIQLLEVKNLSGAKDVGQTVVGYISWRFK